MSTTKPTITVKDSTSFTINEADLTGKKVGDEIETLKNDVPCSDGLQWWIEYNPAGGTEAHKDHVSVYLCVNKPVKATFTFAVDESSFSKRGAGEFVDSPDNWGWKRFTSHEQLRPLFRDGKLTITCNVEFNILPPVTVPRMFQLFEHVPTDGVFAIGSERVPAHKNILSMISPVLQAMFTHNTAEFQSGIIDITEFDFDTVKTVIEFCYGRKWNKLSVETAVGMLRFCDKYFITAVINEIEKLPLLNPSVESFCTILQYAYDCNKNALLADCYNFFKDHQDEIKATEKFANLPLTLVITVLKSAFELKTDAEVLCHAGKNGIDFVVDHLERPLIDSLTIDDFCPAVKFAWECSRDELKKVCAEFLNDRYCEVIMLESFFKLPPECMQGVLKLGYDLKCSGE